MICRECGLEVNESEDYCTRCGSLIADNEEFVDKVGSLSDKESTETKSEQEIKSIPKEKLGKKNKTKQDKENKKDRLMYYSQEKDIVTLKEYCITYLKMLIPIYGIIVLVQALIGSKYIKKSITNSVRALTIVQIIICILIKIITIVTGMSLSTILFLI